MILATTAFPMFVWAFPVGCSTTGDWWYNYFIVSGGDDYLNKMLSVEQYIRNSI